MRQISRRGPNFPPCPFRGELESGPHLKADLGFDQLPHDLMMMNSDPMTFDYSDYSTDGAELSPEDQVGNLLLSMSI